MAILIVDDENNTRDVLSGFLTAQGHKSILIAKDGAEALKMLDQEKGRIRLVISDLEMPVMNGMELAEKISERTFLDLAPFLLITSAELEETHPRVDVTLLKSFRSTELAGALSKAFLKRAELRSTVFFIGSIRPAGFDEALAKATHWKAVIAMDSLEELEKAYEEHSRTLGAVLIDPAIYLSFEKDWLATFKKNPLSRVVQIACLSRDATLIQKLRMNADIFMDSADFDSLPSGLATRAKTDWDIELLFHEAKAQVQKKDWAETEKLAKKILKICPMNAEANILMGDVLKAENKNEDAIERYEKALEINPCLPQAYAKLLELGSEPEKNSKLAALFCPGKFK